MTRQDFLIIFLSLFQLVWAWVFILIVERLERLEINAKPEADKPELSLEKYLEERGK